MRLIDADKLLEGLCKRHDIWMDLIGENNPDIEAMHNYAVNAVNGAPTEPEDMCVTIVVDPGEADLERVKAAHKNMVLCGECKYYLLEACPLQEAMYELSEYDHCSYGERRADK